MSVASKQNLKVMQTGVKPIAYLVNTGQDISEREI